MKNSLEGLKNRFEQVEDKIPELEDRSVNIQSEKKKAERMKKSEQVPRDLWDTVNNTQIHMMGIPKQEERHKGGRKNHWMNISVT